MVHSDWYHASKVHLLYLSIIWQKLTPIFPIKHMCKLQSKLLAHIQGEQLLPFGVHETCSYPFTNGKNAWTSNMDSMQWIAGSVGHFVPFFSGTSVTLIVCSVLHSSGFLPLSAFINSFPQVTKQATTKIQVNHHFQKTLGLLHYIHRSLTCFDNCTGSSVHIQITEARQHLQRTLRQKPCESSSLVLVN